MTNQELLDAIANPDKVFYIVQNGVKIRVEYLGGDRWSYKIV